MKTEELKRENRFF